MQRQKTLIEAAGSTIERPRTSIGAAGSSARAARQVTEHLVTIALDQREMPVPGHRESPLALPLAQPSRDTPQPLKRRGCLGQPAHWRAYRPTDLSGPVQEVDCSVEISVDAETTAALDPAIREGLLVKDLPAPATALRRIPRVHQHDHTASLFLFARELFPSRIDGRRSWCQYATAPATGLRE